MVVLGCDIMDCVIHVESFQAGRIKTTSSGLGDLVEEASACRTALHISSVLHSGLAMQDYASR